MIMTAVEFIVNQLDFLNRERKEKLIDAETYLTHKMILVKQAIEMEKQQIVDAHVTGHNASSSTIKQHDAEQYYNETYKKP
jgi:hypothetical protein